MTARVVAGMLVGLLVACSDDVAIGGGMDPSDALGGADFHVDPLAAVDVAAVDVMEDADAVAEVAAVDVAVVADVAAAGLPAWITGTWLECSGALTISAPAQAVWKPAGKACTFTAQLAWQDGALDFTHISTDQCQGAPPPWFTVGTHATFDGQQLAIVQASLFLGIKRFSHNPTRENWDFTAGTGGMGTMRLCFDEAGKFYDGIWNSANCSLIACSSIVTQVKHADAETHIWTECQGSCPCTSIIIASQKAASAMSGKYAGGNCLQGENGTFTAVVAPFPD